MKKCYQKTGTVYYLEMVAKSSKHGDYGEEILESETGLGENTRVLSEKAIAEDPNGDKASDGCKKKIGKSNWKRNQILF